MGQAHKRQKAADDDEEAAPVAETVPGFPGLPPNVQVVCGNTELQPDSSYATIGSLGVSKHAAASLRQVASYLPPKKIKYFFI